VQREHTYQNLLNNASNPGDIPEYVHTLSLECSPDFIPLKQIGLFGD
jgi:hypothetical protein